MPAKKKNTKKRTRSKSAKKTVKKKAAKKTAKRAAGRSKSTRKRGTSAGQGFSRRRAARSGAQSGDLQGLSRREVADSESVDELLEEGNTFEAGVVEGVEEAEDAGEQEVRTREVLEDDVPGEYLDKDQ